MGILINLAIASLILALAGLVFVLGYKAIMGNKKKDE
jgi:hypothetical protein